MAKGRGNEETLKTWYIGRPAKTGHISGITWGFPGDFDHCVAIAGKHMEPEQAKGFCANLHHRATGAWPGHAPAEQALKKHSEPTPAQIAAASAELVLEMGQEVRMADTPDDGLVTCPTCKGKGTILMGHRKCPDCAGKGKVTPAQAAKIKGAEHFADTLSLRRFRVFADGYQPAPYDANGEGKGEPVTCPNCGKGDALDARYCDQCGFKLAGAQGVKVNGKVVKTAEEVVHGNA